MAMAKKCDICGTLYEVYTLPKSIKNWNSLKTLNVDRYANVLSSDFIECCPKCQQIIQSTIEKIKEGTRDD